MQTNKINVIIPMAGAGNRFQQAGYTMPKPLIDVSGKPMIQLVVENLNIDGNYIFIIQKQHSIGGSLQTFLNTIVPNCIILEVDELTDGPACTALLAKDYIDNNTPLIIVNCDQIIHDFDVDKLIEFSKINKADGVLGAFISSSKKNSYMKLDPQGEVTEIKEKIVISNIATNGLHFWINGKDFVSSSLEMIKAGEKYNNEFYIAPTYNYLVNNGKKILPYFYNLHFPIGTPEDLNKYKKLYGHS